MAEKPASQLAIHGGPKAIQGLEGKGQPKIGVEEFLELADTWGFSPTRMRRLREALDGADAELGDGPFLNRSYNPRPSKVTALEAAAARFLGAKYVYAVSSGTAALHAAYVGAGIGPGDEVIVPGYTFMATAAAVVQARAVPIFCDIDESMTIDPADMERRITPRTKAVAPVHMAGAVCDMAAVMRVARRHKLMVIEDCAQAFGASFRGRRVGTIGDFGTFSVSSYKPTGDGECGLVTARDERAFNRAQQLAECGGLWRPDRFGPERWPGELFCGTNYRLSELEACVNLIQIRKADALLKRWRTNKRRIMARLKPYKGITPQRVHDPDGEVGRMIVFFPPTVAESIKLVEALRAEGVPAGTHAAKTGPDWHVYFDMEPIMGQKTATPEGCPYTCPHYLKGGPPPKYTRDMCPRTNDLYARAVMVYLSQWWTARDCAQVARALNKVLGAFYQENPRGEPWAR